MGIYVWGTGCGAAELLAQGLAADRIAAFVDTYRAGETFLGRPVWEPVRLEGNAAVLVLRGERAAAWISSAPLDRLEVPCAPWRGKAFPGRLYTEYLGSGWYAGYACLGRR